MPGACVAALLVAAADVLVGEVALLLLVLLLLSHLWGSWLGGLSVVPFPLKGATDGESSLCGCLKLGQVCMCQVQ